MNVLHSSNQRYAEDLEGWHEWIGRKVCISGTKPGILKYFGHTEFADGIWCGVELNEPIGKNNGSVKGVQYFTCKENHGIFVSVAKVEKVQEKITWDRNSDGQKKLKNRRFTLHSGPSQGKIGNILPDEDTHISQSDKRRKTTFFKFPNNNDVSGMLVTSHSQKPQLNNSYVISSENNLTENADDILNKTVVLTDENIVNQDDQGNVSTNKIYSESNSVLNATFDINNLQATEMANNNKEIVLDGTFVLGEQNLESTEEQICSSASDRANFNTPENEKSLGILSLSQMKDFTICTEPFINDTNVKLQNPQLSDLCNNSKMPPKSDNRAVSQVSSSGFFQTDLELFQENTVFEDFVFLNNETGNGNNVPYRGPERSPQEFLSRHLSDEVKDICFEPTHHQSSTPSEESKQMFSKRLSLMKSFHLDDSFKFETKRYNSSTPYKPAAPLELMSKMDILDMPVQSVEDSLGNVNVSLIDDQIIPSTFLDTTRSTEEPLQKEKEKSDDLHVLDLVSHPVKADDIPSVYDDSSNGRKSLGEAALKFDLQKMCSIVSHSSGLFLESSKQTVDTNLNITQELGSNVKRNSLSESNTAVFEIPTENIQDVKWTQEGSSFLKDEAFSVSKVHAAVSKPVDSVEKVISVIKKGSDSGNICESVSGSSSNSLYCVQKLSSKATNSDAQDVSEMVKKTESGILHQTFNYNSSYTVPLNSSYTLGGNEVNKNEDNALNKEMTATSKASNESECSLVIDQLHNAPCKEFLPSGNSTNSKKDCVLDVPQNLNATVCISSNINSHNLTFDVTENLKPETVKANRSNSNVCTNLTRQSVGPVLPRNSKIMPSATRSRSALVTNSSKPCVPNNKEQTMSNKFADSLKQNTVQSQKPPNRRYSAASRIVSQENKMQPKNQVVSKIDTNLKASRLSLPKQSLGLPTNAKKQLDADNSVFKVPDSKAIKNVLNYQRLRQDARKENGLDGSQKYPSGKRNVITPQSSENKSFILKENTQAVNVPAQNNENGLPAPSLSRRSSIQSVSSQSSSKIAVFNKNNTSKSNETKDFSSKNDQKLNASTRHQTVGIPPSNQKLNTSRSPKLNDSANSQKSVGSNAKEKQNLMVKKPEISRVPGRLSESGSRRSSSAKTTPLRNIRPCQEVKKKWVSKAELVKEIQDLGASCESKTKEINFTKIQQRKAALGFEALAVLISYVNDEMDPFSQVQLFKDMANTEAALKNTGAKLKSYLTQLELINNSHKENVGTLADKLEINHRKEMKKLKKKHNLTLEKTLAHYKEEITRTKTNFEKKAQARKENIELVLRELNQGLEKHRQEQRNKYAEEIREINDRHGEVENRLQSQVNHLRSQIEVVNQRTKQAEERFYKDKNSKIQRALAKTTDLQKEAESLKAVLEIKNSQVKDAVDHNAQMKEQLEELNRCREEMMNLEKQTNDVQRILHDKTLVQRELSMQTHNLQLSVEKEAMGGRRLNLVNEELKWRLCESLTKKRTSSAFFESRIPMDGKRSLRSGYRSSSLSVLHSRYDESNHLMTTSMPASTGEGQGKTKCNRMSVSLVSTLPSYEESSSVIRSTPKRNRSFSVRPSPSKNFKSPNRRLSFRDYINSNPLRFMKNTLKDSTFYVASPDQDSPGFLRKKNSISWTIDDMPDYYEDLDDSYFYMSGGGNNDSESSSTNGEQSEASISYKEMESSKCEDTNSDSFSVKPENLSGESKRGHKIKEKFSRTVPRSRSLIDKTLVDVYEVQDHSESSSSTVDFMEEKPFEFLGAGEKTFAKEPKRPIGLPRSFSCATSGSLNEKYSTLRDKIDRFCHSDLVLNSSSTSSNSSNSMSPEPVIAEKKVAPSDLSREFKSSEVTVASMIPLIPIESLMPDTEHPTNVFKRDKFHKDTMGHIQDDVKLPSGHGAMDGSFSSEDVKDRAGNSISFSTTSSQCTAMTDSTNIDISWGDDEFLSDNAK